MCVIALLCQCGHAEAIFDPGSAWGVPYAPLLGVLACSLQPLSWFHIVSSELQQPPQPLRAFIFLAYAWFSAALGSWLIRRLSAPHSRFFFRAAALALAFLPAAFSSAPCFSYARRLALASAPATTGSIW